MEFLPNFVISCAVSIIVNACSRTQESCYSDYALLREIKKERLESRFHTPYPPPPILEKQLLLQQT